MITGMAVVIAFMAPFALLGFLVAAKLASESSKPMDASNRINRIRLFWFALTRPQVFANVEGFEWLKRDEYDNISGKGD